MIRRERLRLVAALVLVIALAAPVTPAQAADGGWPGRIWSWLAAVLPWQPPVQTTCDWGPMIDPNGGCRSTATGASTDQCSSIDPDGRCRDGVTPDQGSSIDPDG